MQNNLQKIDITPYDALVQSMNDILELHNIMDNGTFTDDVLRFNSESIAGVFELDFSIFDLSDFNGNKCYKVTCHGGVIKLTNKELAKVLFLEHLEKSSTLYYYHHHGFKFIAKLYSFLRSYDLDSVEKDELLDFYNFVFSHKLETNNLIRSFSPPAFQSLTGSALSLNNLAQYLKYYHVDGLIGSITIDEEQEKLNEACQSQLGMTLSEYRNGESFNYLALDIGKHYIDHCGNLFEDNVQYALAARMTLNETIKEVQDELAQGSLEAIQPVVAQAILGNKLSDLPESQSRIWKQSKLEYIYNTALKNFIRNFNDYARVSSAFKLDVVNDIVNHSGLPDRYDAQEFVRSMLFTSLIDGNVKSIESIFEEYFSALKTSNEAPNITTKEFISICDNTIASHIEMLPKNLGAARQLCKKYSNRVCVESTSEGVRKFKAGLNMVASCGATVVVGLLGWRRSEYGFSLSDINIKRNEAVLDNLYTPLRFIVNWTVQKTSGETKLDREITQYAYMVIFLLDKLNDSLEYLPAIYYASKSRSKGKNPSSDSSIYMASLVEYAWPDFIKNYSEKGKILNGADEQLKSDLKKLEADLPIYTLCQTNNSQSFGKKLKQYCNGELSEFETKILDDKLPLSTKEKLKDSNIELSSKDISKIRMQVLQDIAYPTPHAFRHVWAEAVLRRYRGDIGKFIRANFKHLDESFFMAYLRDKETKAVYQVAKRTTINAIVRQQLLSLTNNDRVFAGGIDRFLAKAVASTKVISRDEYTELSKKISEERIVNISPRPWVTCMLRVRTESAAKCSEDGEPQPHRAEPKFCLGCINANIAEGNFNGIVVYIKPDIDACRDPNLPSFIRAMHEPVVRLALKRVEELAANTHKFNDFIKHLRETLEIAEKLNRVT